VEGNGFPLSLWWAHNILALKCWGTVKREAKMWAHKGKRGNPMGECWCGGSLKSSSGTEPPFAHYHLQAHQSSQEKSLRLIAGSTISCDWWWAQRW
jgi:mannose-6-phosphate isomerase class I